MSLTTPTTQEISDNIVAQLEASLGQTVPILPKAFIRVLAKALAGVFILLYKYAGFIFLQMFVATASSKSTTVLGGAVTPLTQWGRLIGIGDPIPATRAELTVDITVEVIGGSLPAGTQLINSDNGVTYITVAAVNLDAATVQATIRAAADQAGGGGVGTIGNLTVGAVVSFANPLANLARDATVAAVVTTGADGEATAVYRQRILDQFQQRPQGGALADYRAWAKEAAGIKNVYPYTSDCPGQVDVYIESSTEADGIPTAAQLQAALDLINLDVSGRATRRPANALANTFPINRLSFAVVVSGLLVDNPATVQANIITAVESYFLGREPYLLGLSVLPRVDRVTSSGVNGVVDSVVSAAGGVFTEATISLDSVLLDRYTLLVGEKAKASSVSFT